MPTNRQKNEQADAFRHGELLSCSLSDYQFQFALERLLAFEQDFMLLLSTGRMMSQQDCLTWELVGVVKKHILKAGQQAICARKKQAKITLTITGWKLLRALPHTPIASPGRVPARPGEYGQDEYRQFAESELDYLIDLMLNKSINQFRYYVTRIQPVADPQKEPGFVG